MKYIPLSLVPPALHGRSHRRQQRRAVRWRATELCKPGALPAVNVELLEKMRAFMLATSSSNGAESRIGSAHRQKRGPLGIGSRDKSPIWTVGAWGAVFAPSRSVACRLACSTLDESRLRLQSR